MTLSGNAGAISPDAALHDSHATHTASGIAASRVLGVPVSTVNMRQAVGTICGWIKSAQSHLVCVRDVHGVMRSLEDPALLHIHERAGLVVPDGMPLVWILQHRGYDAVSRVSGADLVDALCAASVEAGIRHYFYGGKDGVAERMAQALTAKYPGLIVAGLGSPPFRALSPEEDAVETARIVAASPGVVWVGMSTPKQEHWMGAHVGRIPGATLIGVGAAFDFFAGDVKRSPQWMRESGLEWLHRLYSEPRRLWRRYLIMAPKFVFLVARGSRGSRAKCP